MCEQACNINHNDENSSKLGTLEVLQLQIRLHQVRQRRSNEGTILQ